jgi:DNA-binding PadR family transcriptional regulator
MNFMTLAPLPPAPRNGSALHDAGVESLRKKGIAYISVTDIVSGMARPLTNAPLTPAVLHILLALSTRERHGYGIMKQVESDSQGKVKMGPGTLYGSIGRMIDAGLIHESDKRVDPEMDDERRVYYEITGLGRKALGAELERYRGVVAVAQQKRLSPHACGNAG